MKKLKSRLKRLIYNIRFLSFKKEVKKMDRNQKDSPFITFWVVFNSKVEIVSIRGIFSIRFSFIILQPAPSFSKIFEKRQIVLLYWFAAQQQSSTLRQQKFPSFYSKFNARSDELNLGLYKSKEFVQKMKKLNSSLKTQINNIRFLRLNK